MPSAPLQQLEPRSWPQPASAPPTRALASVPASADPKRCVPVSAPAGLVELSTLIPDLLLVAGYAGPDNFTGAPLPGYEARVAWLERDAALALARAAGAVRAQGMRLVIYDAYRPQRASRAMVSWAKREGHEALLSQGWVAPRSAHNRGRAVDLGLAGVGGEILDMGSAWDQFDARSHFRGVGGAAMERRQVLRSAMRDAGFRPYAKEWWHFGYAGEGEAPALDLPYACAEG